MARNVALVGSARREAQGWQRLPENEQDACQFAQSVRSPADHQAEEGRRIIAFPKRDFLLALHSVQFCQRSSRRDGLTYSTSILPDKLGQI